MGDDGEALIDLTGEALVRILLASESAALAEVGRLRSIIDRADLALGNISPAALGQAAAMLRWASFDSLGFNLENTVKTVKAVRAILDEADHG